MAETPGQKKKRDALKLFNTIPPPTKAGAPAGSRREGLKWQKAMREVLEHGDAHYVVTAIGKSSKNKEVDGNAVDRMSYKLLRYTRDAKEGSELVVAVNAAFTKYSSTEWSEILAQVDWLRSKAPAARIHVLQTEADYRSYIDGRFGP